MMYKVRQGQNKTQIELSNLILQAILAAPNSFNLLESFLTDLIDTEFPNLPDDKKWLMHREMFQSCGILLARGLPHQYAKIGIWVYPDNTIAGLTPIYDEHGKEIYPLVTKEST